MSESALSDDDENFICDVNIHMLNRFIITFNDSYCTSITDILSRFVINDWSISMMIVNIWQFKEWIYNSAVMILIAEYINTIIELVKKIQWMFYQCSYENTMNVEWFIMLKSSDFQSLTDSLLRII